MDRDAHGTCPGRVRRLAVTLLLAVTLASSGGCSILGYALSPLDRERTVNVEARYTDLVGKRVAVLVAAPERTLVKYPQARPSLTKSISRALSEHIDDVTLMNPKQVLRFQRKNQYWHTLRYSRLIEQMDVDRIVLIDLIDYQTHEPGNRHVFKGVVNANVSVIDASAADPDNLAFSTQIRVQHPDNSVGAVNRDEQTIELAAVQKFTRKATRLFYKHQEKR